MLLTVVSTSTTGASDVNTYYINVDVSMQQSGFPYNMNIAGEDVPTVVQSSPNVIDVDNDGHPEIFFGDNNGMLYGIDYYGDMLPPFPMDIGSAIIGSVILSDLDFDSIPELVFGTESGDMYALHLDGSLYNQMPIPYAFSYYSAPLVYDLDGDLDLEIIAGTSLSINVFDIKQEGKNDDYWSMFRGNSKRSGLNTFTPLCAYGDINTDGNIDILDVLEQINFILDIIEPTEADICASDLNADDNIDLLDSILLINIILNP